VLKERFAQAPRCDVYDRLKAGIFNIQRVCGWGGVGGGGPVPPFTHRKLGNSC